MQYLAYVLYPAGIDYWYVIKGFDGGDEFVWVIYADSVLIAEPQVSPELHETKQLVIGT